jgi:hypothetical protein
MAVDDGKCCKYLMARCDKLIVYSSICSSDCCFDHGLVECYKERRLLRRFTSHDSSIYDSS